MSPSFSLSLSIDIDIDVYVYIHAYMYIYTYMYIFLCVCVCVCVCVCILLITVPGTEQVLSTKMRDLSAGLEGLLGRWNEWKELKREFCSPRETTACHCVTPRALMRASSPWGLLSAPCISPNGKIRLLAHRPAQL